MQTCSYPRQNATRAELIWKMKCVQSNYSFASCEDIVPTFKAMFPPGYSPDDHMSLGSTKVSYIVGEATGPYFI